MKNSLQDLNNYLFESLERINDDDLTDEELEKEIKRSEAVTKVASTNHQQRRGAAQGSAVR